MNLENLNVTELNAQEMQNVDGGGKIAEWVGYTAGYVAGKLEEAAEWVSETMEAYAPTKLNNLR